MEKLSTGKKDKRSSIVRAIQVTDSLEFDGRASWIACVCISLAHLIIVGICILYGVFFPEILKDFKAGKAKTAMPGSFSVAFLLMLCPVASVFTTRFNCRITIFCGSMLSALGLLGSAFAPNIYVLSITYGFVLGWGTCLVYMAGFRMVPLYFDKHRSFAMAIVSASGPGAGVVILSPIIQTLIDRLGWRKTMLVLASLSLATAVLGAGITRKVQPEESPVLEKRCKVSVITSSLHCSVLKDPIMILLMIMNIVAYMGHYMPLIHLINYAEGIGISSNEASWIYPIIGIISTISRVLTGKVGDTDRCSFYHIYQTGLALMLVTDFLIPMANKVEYLYAYAAMQGIGEGMYFTAPMCLALTVNPHYGIGWLWFVSAFPIFVAPSLAGFIADSSDSYTPLFYTAGSFLILAFLVPYFRHCIKQREPCRSELLMSDTSTTLLVVEKESVV